MSHYLPIVLSYERNEEALIKWLKVIYGEQPRMKDGRYKSWADLLHDIQNGDESCYRLANGIKKVIGGEM
jgi:hypothetical protein